MLKKLNFLQVSSLILLVFIFIYTLIIYNHSPDIIPSHFGLNGKVDDTSSKQFLIIFPLIASFVYFGLSFLRDKPELSNYPIKITPENKDKQYKLSKLLLDTMLIFMMIVFITCLWSVDYSAQYGSSEYAQYLIPFYVVTPIFLVIIYIFRARKAQ